MNQSKILNRLLEDMYDIRSVVVAAKPDDSELRATTRQMISALEQIKQAPSVPAETYQWLYHLAAKLMDAEHGALLKPDDYGLIPESAQHALLQHSEQRQQLLMEALQEIPSTHALLNQIGKLMGAKSETQASLQAKARQVVTVVREHLQHDTDLRKELQGLIQAFNPAISAISSVLEQAGEESPELKQAQDLLAQELPEDVDQARALLRSAHQSILQAGNKLATASEKLNETIQAQVEKLSSLSNKLEQAESDARNDPLTGLPNRRRLAEFLGEVGKSAFCFLVVDIDFFKKVNDTYGHDVGDEILQQLASILQNNIRNTDLVARIGGEEFCVVFVNTPIDVSFTLADELRQKIADSAFQTQQGVLKITISVGLAEHEIGKPAGKTFKAADKALYASKNNGRNQVTIAKAQ